MAVYVLDEIDDQGKFRQHKTLPGFPSADAARAAGTELSRYLREVAIFGHTVRQAQNVLKATGA